MGEQRVGNRGYSLKVQRQRKMSFLVNLSVVGGIPWWSSG